MASTAPAAEETGLAGLARAVAQMGSHIDWMRERMRLLEAVIENFPGGISLFDDSLRMVLCNRRQQEMLEYPPELMANGYPHMEELFRFNARRGEYGPGDVETIVAKKIALARRREPHCYDRTRPNGTVIEVRGMPLEGGGFITTYLDVTDQRRTQALVAHMAHHDALTNLPNRMLFNDRLKTAIAQVKRGGLMAVHYLDLDDFKPVNDNFGHQAGDELLVGVASRLRQSVREHDTIARLGGDEFAIVQTSLHNPRDAEVLARRLLSIFSSPFPVTGTQVRVGVSIGIALAPDDGLSSDDLLIKADNALYRSKSSGRGRFSFFRHGG